MYSSDIKKIFRQIRIHPADANYQRIFWRDDSKSELAIDVYRLLTVTYGTASAPFLANRVLKQLAQDEGVNFPLAMSVLEEDVYVDNLLFGAEDSVLLQQTRDQLNWLLMAGGFRPRKWASNNSRLLLDIPESDHGLATDKQLTKDANFKILGVTWCPRSDSFKVNTRISPVAAFTKSFLLMLARIFDPFGLVAPVTITAKILMQALWLQKVDWDEPLTDDLLRRCLQYQTQLLNLNGIAIPRWTGQGNESHRIELHGYANASNSAYAAVIYLRVESILGQIQVSLLYSKTKVAPLKVQSVPRLELCAAVLLVRAIEFVEKSMKLHQVPTYCWTDSSVVLAFLKSVPVRWKTFVANRVSEIQTRLPNASWRHVLSTSNPADCASRGITVKELTSHGL